MAYVRYRRSLNSKNNCYRIKQDFIDCDTTRISSQSSDHEATEKIVVNVSGYRYLIDRNIVNRSSLLAPDSIELEKYYDSKKDEYFFDKQRPTFEAIINNLVEDEPITRPEDIPIDVFLEEIRFYALDRDSIEEYLWQEGLLKEEKEPPEPPSQKDRLFIWLFLHKAYWMTEINKLDWRQNRIKKWVKLSKLYSILTFTLIFVSLTIFCVETCFVIRAGDAKKDWAIAKKNDANNQLALSILHSVEWLCDIWFFIEFGLHFYGTADRFKFFKKFMTWFDIIALIPFIIAVINAIAENSIDSYTAAVLSKARILHIFRLGKLAKYSRGLAILGKTLVESKNILTMLISLQMILAVLFSTVVHYGDTVFFDGDFQPNGKYSCSQPKIPDWKNILDDVFHQRNVTHDLSNKSHTDCKDAHMKVGIVNLIDAMWWSIVTMTTVGSGEVVPASVMSKLAGSLCALVGILSIAFPVPIVVSNFNYLYTLDKEDYKLVPEDLMSENSGCKIFLREGKLSVVSISDLAGLTTFRET